MFKPIDQKSDTLDQKLNVLNIQQITYSINIQQNKHTFCELKTSIALILSHHLFHTLVPCKLQTIVLSGRDSCYQKQVRAG